MTPRRRDRDRRPSRGPPDREPGRLLLIVCEGEVTEPTYFKALARWARNPRVRIELVPRAGVPMTLVQEAAARREEALRRARSERDENAAYDEVWCVFDVDQHPRLAEAREYARVHELRTAISNPCFELWLLLHYRENPGPQQRKTLQSMLRDITPTIEPKYIHPDILLGYDDAWRRAERMAREAVERGEAHGNPTTEVYLLADSIDEAGRTRRAPPLVDDGGRRKAEAAAEAARAQFELELSRAADEPDEPLS